MKVDRVLTVVVAIGALFVAGCGGDDDAASGGADAKKAPTGEGAKGNVNWCIGKDTSGAYGSAIDLFKKQEPAVTAKLVELPESADEQRTQLVQRLRAKSTECDVLGMDVVWTAEFAAQGWLQDTSEVISKRKDEFIPSTLETAKYEDKYLAVPYNSNAGFIYFRTDEAGKEPPKTWEDDLQEGPGGDGIVYQGARYEGLTVNFLELLYSGGGKVLSDDGKSVEIDSEAGQKALKFMADGVKDGADLEGHHHLHGAAVAARVPHQQGHLHAQLAVCLRTGQGFAAREEVRHHHLPELRRRRRRQRPGRLSTWRSRHTRRTRRGRRPSSPTPPARRCRRRTSSTSRCPRPPRRRMRIRRW